MGTAVDFNEPLTTTWIGTKYSPAQDLLLGPEEALRAKLDDFLAAAVPTSDSIERAAALQGARVHMSQFSPIPLRVHGLPAGFIEVLHDGRIKRVQEIHLSRMDIELMPLSAIAWPALKLLVPKLDALLTPQLYALDVWPGGAGVTVLLVGRWKPGWVIDDDINESIQHLIDCVDAVTLLHEVDNDHMRQATPMYQSIAQAWHSWDVTAMGLYILTVFLGSESTDMLMPWSSKRNISWQQLVHRATNNTIRGVHGMVAKVHGMLLMAVLSLPYSDDDAGMEEASWRYAHLLSTVTGQVIWLLLVIGARCIVPARVESDVWCQLHMAEVLTYLQRCAAAHDAHDQLPRPEPHMPPTTSFHGRHRVGDTMWPGWLGLDIGRPGVQGIVVADQAVVPLAALKM